MLGYMYFNLNKYSSILDKGPSSHLLGDVCFESLIVAELGTSVVNLRAYIGI